MGAKSSSKLSALVSFFSLHPSPIKEGVQRPQSIGMIVKILYLKAECKLSLPHSPEDLQQRSLTVDLAFRSTLRPPPHPLKILKGWKMSLCLVTLVLVAAQVGPVLLSKEIWSLECPL